MLEDVRRRTINGKGMPQRRDMKKRWLPRAVEFYCYLLFRNLMAMHLAKVNSHCDSEQKKKTRKIRSFSYYGARREM